MILVNKEKAQARGMQSFKRIQDNEVKETALQARYRIRKAQEQALAEAAKNNESHDESAFYNSVMAECDHRSGAPTTTSMNFDNHNKRDKDVSKSDSKKLQLSKGHFKIQCDSSQNQTESFLSKRNQSVNDSIDMSIGPSLGQLNQFHGFLIDQIKGERFRLPHGTSVAPPTKKKTFESGTSEEVESDNSYN